MTPAMAIMARSISMTIAVAGRTRRSYVLPRSFNHSVKAGRVYIPTRLHRTVGETPKQPKMPRPPNGGGGLGYMKDGSPPWGGLGGYPFTPWERALGARGETSPSCMHTAYRPRRVKT
jgi:hypothetical protein